MGDLDSAWAKLDWAKGHVDQVRAEMTAPDDPKRDVVPLMRQYEPEVKAVVYRIADRSHWPLSVGDAVHNFRSALDHAWWQCACKKLRREPTEKEARQIQFPIRSPGGEWDPNKHLQWVEPGVVKIAKIEQPSKGWNLSKFHPLGSLNRLSNVDKHRELTIFVVTRSSVQSLTAPHCRYRDCTPSSDPAGKIASLSLPPESADAAKK